MNFAVRFLVLLLHVLYVLITPILWLKSRRKKQTIPTISDGLLKISATELAAKIRKREVRPTFNFPPKKFINVSNRLRLPPSSGEQRASLHGVHQTHQGSEPVLERHRRGEIRKRLAGRPQHRLLFTRISRKRRGVGENKTFVRSTAHS
jgi:hypothetical protein